MLLGELHHSLEPLPEGEGPTGENLLQGLQKHTVRSRGRPAVGIHVRPGLPRVLAVATLLNWDQETDMLLKSSAKSGLLKIFWAKKCWLYWSRLWLVWTSEVNLLLRVLYIILQGTRSGTTNGILSWWRRKRGFA